MRDILLIRRGDACIAPHTDSRRSRDDRSRRRAGLPSPIDGPQRYAPPSMNRSVTDLTSFRFDKRDWCLVRMRGTQTVDVCKATWARHPDPAPFSFPNTGGMGVSIHTLSSLLHRRGKIGRGGRGSFPIVPLGYRDRRKQVIYSAITHGCQGFLMDGGAKRTGAGIFSTW